MTKTIISYLSSLTNYHFEQATLERIALERGVQDVEKMEDLTKKDRDLLLADMLLVLYLTPSETASFSKKHGSFSMSIGSQVITDKDGLYDMMVRLYARWGDDKLEDLDGESGLQWLE